MVELTYLLS